MEWTNNGKAKIDERMSRFTNKLYKNKRKDCLSSPDVINALNDIHIDFAVILIDKATGNILFLLKELIPLLLQQNWN